MDTIAPITPDSHNHEMAWRVTHDENGALLPEPVLLAMFAQLMAERNHYLTLLDKGL